MGVDAYQTYQTSRTTFSAALSAAPVTILARDTALSLGQVSTKYPSRCRPQKNQLSTLHSYTDDNMTSIIISWCLVETYSVMCAAPWARVAPEIVARRRLWRHPPLNTPLCEEELLPMFWVRPSPQSF